MTRAERPAAPSVLPDSESSPLRILVAEDNRTNQRVATAMLGQLGYAVEIVDNGRLAVEKLENAFYDVIFMDRHMPELDGIEAAKRIRLLPGKRPYIIAMTASAFVNDRATYLNAGMDDFVAKPARLDDLSHVLARARERTAFNGNVGQTVEKPQTNHDALPVYDPAPMTNLRAMEAMTMDTPGFVRDLCTEFLRDSAERIGRFPDLVVALDAQTIEREAHSLKSASASLGALRMSATCAELERLTNGGTVDGCTPLVVRLHGEFLEAKVNIEREMTNLLPHVAE